MKVVLIVALTVCVAVIPKCKPRIPHPPYVHPATKGWTMVANHTDDLDENSKWTVVNTACLANDLVDVAKSPNLDEAIQAIADNFGHLHARMHGLAEDLREASTPEERQVRIGVFVVCETAA